MSSLFVLRLSCLLLFILVGCTSRIEVPAPTSALTPTRLPSPSPSSPPLARPSPDHALLFIEPTVTNTPTFTPQQVDERAIYAYLLNNPPYPFHPPTNMTRLSDWSLIWDLDPLVGYAEAHAAIPAITPALWDEFRTQNSTSLFIPRELPARERFGWLSHEILEGAFRREKSMYENWLEYYETLEYKGGIEVPEAGYMVFSRITFVDPDHAFLIVRVECGLGCTRGFLYLFGQENDEWTMVSDTTLWEEGDWETARLMVSQSPSEVLEGTPTPTISVMILPDTTPLTIPSVTPIPPTPTPLSFADSQRAALEAEIYAVVYQTSIYHHRSERPIWIADRTHPFTQGYLDSEYPEDREYLYVLFYDLESLAPTFSRETWSEFMQLNLDPYKMPPAIPLEPAYTFISNAEIETLWEEVNGGIFEGDILFFSRVGFNAARTQALVYSSNWCGALCGSGHIHVLEFRDGAWVVIAETELWIS